MTDTYIGIFSPKFGQKTLIPKEYIAKHISNWNTDVVSFCKPIPNFLAWTNHIHPGFLELFVPLCMELGIKVQEPQCVVYANQFLAKHSVYKDYVDNCLRPAIDLLETEKYINVWEDSRYKGLPSNKLKLLTGLDYYPMHTFLLERMMSMWIDHKQLSYTCVY